MKLTLGFALTADDPGAVYTARSLELHHANLDVESIQIVVVDNSDVTSTHCDALQKELKDIENLHYVRDTSMVSSYLTRNKVFEEAEGDVVLCCDSHVLFQQGAIESLVRYFNENPHSNDLITGPLLRRADTISATQQFIYDWEGAPDTALKGHPMSVFGTWMIDRRGVDRTFPVFEIQKTGLGAFACRKAAWPGFHESFTGYGGGEVYLFEKFRADGNKCLCLPGLRWWHNFMDYEKPLYTRSWEDWSRNALTTAVVLDRTDIFDAAVTQLKGKAPQQLEKVLNRFERPEGKVVYRRPPTPGWELKKLFYDVAPDYEPCSRCITDMFFMNRLGPQGCRDNMEHLINVIMPRARKHIKAKHPWAAAVFSKVQLAGKLADAAISREVERLINQAIDQSLEAVA